MRKKISSIGERYFEQATLKCDTNLFSARSDHSQSPGTMNRVCFNPIAFERLSYIEIKEINQTIKQSNNQTIKQSNNQTIELHSAEFCITLNSRLEYVFKVDH
jgi:hypothetical protein